MRILGIELFFYHNMSFKTWRHLELGFFVLTISAFTFPGIGIVHGLGSLTSFSAVLSAVYLL
jgi:hypothetical protein